MFSLLLVAFTIKYRFSVVLCLCMCYTAYLISYDVVMLVLLAFITTAATIQTVSCIFYFFFVLIIFVLVLRMMPSSEKNRLLSPVHCLSLGRRLWMVGSLVYEDVLALLKHVAWLMGLRTMLWQGINSKSKTLVCWILNFLLSLSLSLSVHVFTTSSWGSYYLECLLWFY